MSKTTKIPVELQVILRDLSIVETDNTKLLQKVKQRAACQVNDYMQIMLSKLHVTHMNSKSLQETVAETRLVLMRVQQEDESGERNQKTDVVV